MMEHPIDNSAPGIAKCAEGDKICEQYPQYMRRGGMVYYEYVCVRMVCMHVNAAYMCAHVFMCVCMYICMRA